MRKEFIGSGLFWLSVVLGALLGLALAAILALPVAAIALRFL